MDSSNATHRVYHVDFPYTDDRFLHGKPLESNRLYRLEFPDAARLLPLELVRFIFQYSANDGHFQSRRLALISRASNRWVSPILYRVVELFDFAAVKFFERTMRNYLKQHPSGDFFPQTVKHLGLFISPEELGRRLKHRIEAERWPIRQKLEKSIEFIMAHCTGLQSFFTMTAIRWGPYEPPCMFVPAWPAPPLGIDHEREHAPASTDRAAKMVYVGFGRGIAPHVDWDEWDHQPNRLSPHVQHIMVDPGHVSQADWPILLSRPTLKSVVLPQVVWKYWVEGETRSLYAEQTRGPYPSWRLPPLSPSAFLKLSVMESRHSRRYMRRERYLLWKKLSDLDRVDPDAGWQSVFDHIRDIPAQAGGFSYDDFLAISPHIVQLVRKNVAIRNENA